jgi:hypothetical protein
MTVEPLADHQMRAVRASLEPDLTAVLASRRCP